MKRFWVEVPDWVDEELVRKKVKEIAYSLSYIPVDYLRKKLSITELKEDISISESILRLREKERERTA
ncbi:MAG: hypothetical protein J7K49_02815 [Thaumarchaeota archaeon]|nr:hypothetical protein [Nitrososphaerota archaeon]